MWVKVCVWWGGRWGVCVCVVGGVCGIGRWQAGRQGRQGKAGKNSRCPRTQREREPFFLFLSR